MVKELKNVQCDKCEKTGSMFINNKYKIECGSCNTILVSDSDTDNIYSESDVKELIDRIEYNQIVLICRDCGGNLENDSSYNDEDNRLSCQDCGTDYVAVEVQ